MGFADRPVVPRVSRTSSLRVLPLSGQLGQPQPQPRYIRETKSGCGAQRDRPGGACAGLDGEIASAMITHSFQVQILVMTYPQGRSVITLFCPSSAKWPIGRASSRR
jgi:hypothetical protein